MSRPQAQESLKELKILINHKKNASEIWIVYVGYICTKKKNEGMHIPQNAFPLYDPNKFENYSVFFFFFWGFKFLSALQIQDNTGPRNNIPWIPVVTNQTLNSSL